mgnify:CR=1 FL=1
MRTRRTRRPVQFSTARSVVAAAALASPWLSATQALAVNATYLAVNGTWTEGAKWSTAPLFPNNGSGGQNYDVFVDFAGAYTLTLNSPITVNSMLLAAAGATFSHASGGVLNIVGPINVQNGLYRLNSGTIQAAQMTVSGNGSLSVGSGGGTFTDNATLTGTLNLLDANSKLTFRSGANLLGNATLATSGHTLGWMHSATYANSISMDGTTSRIDISSPDGVNSATLTLAAGASVVGRGTLSSDTNGAASANAIVNNGQITGNNAAGRLDISPDVFINSGTVTLSSGTLSINAGSWSSLGSGRIVQNDGTLLLGGTFELDTANLTRTGGTVTINGTVNNAGRHFAINNTTGSIRFNGGTINGGTMTQSGTAALVLGTNAATFANNASFVGNLAIDDANGKVVFASGSNFTGNASLNGTTNQVGYVYDATIGGNRTITFNNTGGRLDVSANGTLASTLTIPPGVTLRSLNRGTLSSDTFGAADGNRIINNGLIISDDPAAAVGIEPDIFINNGTVSANSGTVAINAASWSSAGGNLVLNNGTLVLGGNTTTAGLNLPGLQRTGGTLTLSATVNNTGATLALNDAVGLVRFPGAINGGTITQTANGRLQFVSQGGTISNGATIVGGLEFDVSSGKVLFRTGADFTGDATLTANSSSLGYGYNHTIADNRTINLVGSGARLDISGEGTDPNTLILAPGTTVRGRGVVGSDSFVAAQGNQIINRGLIQADISAGTLSVEPDILTNEGTLAAIGNGRLNVVSTIVGNIGTLSADGQGSAVRVFGGQYTLNQRITVQNRGLISLQGKPTKSADFDASGAIIFNYSGASPLATFQQQLVTGYAAGAWNGPGINSSQATQGAFAGRTGVALAEATDLFQTFPATFIGDSIDSTTLLLRFTLNGDTNFDLAVNIGDFSILAANFNQPNRRWATGDFNYDGNAGIGDFALLAANFNQTLPAADTPRPGAVPEPSSALAVPALALLRRRRR